MGVSPFLGNIIKMNNERMQSLLQKTNHGKYTRTGSSSRSGGGGGGDGGSRGSALINAASAYSGTPYQWGGTSRSGMDCSGMVQAAARDAGYSIPRTASQQYNYLQHVPLEQAVPGDILYFVSPSSPSNWHTGIYLGNGNMLHSGGGGVGVVPIGNRQIRGVGRL